MRNRGVLWILCVALVAIASLPLRGGLAKSAPATLHGRVVLRPLSFIEEKSRPAVLARQGELASRGYKVTDDGAWIVYPEAPAAGYKIIAGRRTVFTRPDGSFALQGSSAGEVVVAHPAIDGLEARFDPSHLSTSADKPHVLVWPVPFKVGGDVMGTDGSCCHVVAREGAQPSTSRLDAPGSADGLLVAGSYHGYAKPTSVRKEARGTYPDPDNNPPPCLQDDGPAQSGIEALDYVGSTCDAYVRAGVCVNEWPATDLVYNTAVASPVLRLLGMSGEILTVPIKPERKASCSNNHKNRACQQVQIGDVSVDADGVIKPGSSGKVMVDPGVPHSFVVHNNGVYGKTEITKVRDELGGTLDCGAALLHYEAIGNRFLYHPDQTVVYRENAEKDGTDTYVFETDGEAVTVSFVSKVGPPRLVVTGTVTFTESGVFNDGSTTSNDSINVVATQKCVYKVKREGHSLDLDEISSHVTVQQVEGGGMTVVPDFKTTTWRWLPKLGANALCYLSDVHMSVDSAGAIHGALVVENPLICVRSSLADTDDERFAMTVVVEPFRTEAFKKQLGFVIPKGSKAASGSATMAINEKDLKGSLSVKYDVTFVGR